MPKLGAGGLGAVRIVKPFERLVERNDLDGTNRPAEYSLLDGFATLVTDGRQCPTCSS
jgi:hypothetical protein